jgi:hypothetical protein
MPKTKTTGTMLPLPLQFMAAWLAVWLDRVLWEQVEHHKRDHQGLDNALIAANEAVNGNGKVVRRDRLGGLLSFYHREAA